jgi:hypothetical protein
MMESAQNRQLWHWTCGGNIAQQCRRGQLKLAAENTYIAPVKTITSHGLLLLLLLFRPILAPAQSNSVTQLLTVEVKPLVKIAVTGNPGPLFVTDMGSGSEATVVTDNSTLYSILTNIENMKIVASINGPMPLGTKLMVKLETSAGVTNGFVDVSNASTPVDVVTGINKGVDRNQSITYAFAADRSVAQVSSDSRVVTLTFTN